MARERGKRVFIKDIEFTFQVRSTGGRSWEDTETETGPKPVAGVCFQESVSELGPP